MALRGNWASDVILRKVVESSPLSVGHLEAPWIIYYSALHRTEDREVFLFPYVWSRATNLLRFRHAQVMFREVLDSEWQPLNHDKAK